MIKKTPPMGWNTWNTFGENINEELIMKTADIMAASGLLENGYEYLVIDDCWSLHERDEKGRLVADPAKFPHGMKYVADYVHSKGLKFGMYSCCGKLTCAGYPSSYEHEFVDAETFADWGVDYLKYDYCFHSKIVPSNVLYRRMGLALKNCGRDILFSACTWGCDETHNWIRETGADIWRSTGDIFDNWESIKSLTYQQEDRLAFGGIGCFNDMDMLVVGMNAGSTNDYMRDNKGMSDEQYRAHFSIWALFASPLMIGCDIRNMSEATKATLMNKKVIEINQDADCRQVMKLKCYWDSPDKRIYARMLSNGDIAIGLFNFSEDEQQLGMYPEELGIAESTGKTLLLEDAWTGETERVTNGMYTCKLAGNGFKLFRAKVVDK